MFSTKIEDLSAQCGIAHLPSLLCGTYSSSLGPETERRGFRVH